MPSSSGSSNMGGGIGGSGDSTRSRGPGKDQGGKGSGGLRFSAKEASQFGGLQGGALGQQISNFNASIARRGRTQQLNEIAQTLNLLPTNLFAFSPVKDQARFIGELAGQGLAPGGDPGRELHDRAERRGVVRGRPVGGVGAAGRVPV